MASENESVAEIVSKVHSGDYGCAKCGDLCDCHNADKIIASIADRIEAAHRREIAELRGALKEAYGTLYSISCSRYGEGLTCTDDIHDLVTMARECSDELYANENLRKALEGANDDNA